MDGGGEARQPGVVEHLGETPFGLVWIHRCRSVFHALGSRRRSETRPRSHEPSGRRAAISA
jgi:hypothetical protein